MRKLVLLGAIVLLIAGIAMTVMMIRAGCPWWLGRNMGWAYFVGACGR